MTIDHSPRTLFNSVAALYDAARPGYPEALIEDVLALSGIPAEGRILEIGCGPGKATLPFARRGYSMLCLELGEDLAALARENCEPYPKVKIQTIAFEAWETQERAFDLVISAQAFHWIPSEIGYPKVQQALKQSGTMALFWNQHPDSEPEFFETLAELYRTKAPHLAQKEMGWEAWAKRMEAEINETGLFSRVQVRTYSWQQQYTAGQYLNLLNTYSDYLSLTEEVRQDLFAAIRELIQAHGGIVTRPYVTVLFLAQVKV
jgi:SAM-dependent methyltransferase